MALDLEREQEAMVDALAEKLDERLRQWKPDTAAEVRERILEVIELADQDLLDVARPRAAEQEVLDLLDETPPVRSCCHCLSPGSQPAAISRLVRASHHSGEEQPI